LSAAARLAPDPGWLVPDWEAPHVGALMTTRAGGVSAAPFDSLNLGHGGDDADAVRRNRARVVEAIGAAPVWLRQVHGRRVVRVHAHDTAAGAALHEADAAVTTEPGVACAIQVADCLPVLFAAPRGVAGAHAGWRGLAGGVLEATVLALCEATGAAPDQLDAWLGPCIGPARFQVGVDVLEAFGVDPARPGAAFRAERPGKWLADLPRLARARLAARGVTRVHGGRWCTVGDPARFFSFRRDRTTGRMAALVWLRG
jgi:YfiH family protein